MAALMLLLGLSSLLPRLASAQRRHRVRDGDTLTRIARRYRVTIASIRALNRIRNDRIRPGQRLRIPGRHARLFRRHRVRPGDNLARMARRYHVSVNALRIANRLRNDALRPGQLLVVPRRGQDPRAARAAARGENPVLRAARVVLNAEQRREAELRARQYGLGSLRLAQRMLLDPTDPRHIEAAGGGDIEGTLQMPVDHGRFLRGWGSGPNGYHLAVDIGGPPGTPIRATERGVIAYAGHGIRGYGNMIILVHPNGLITAYAHNRRNMVMAGQRVVRGQQIAELGQTGLARGPHCHFILIYQGQHCDPLPLFRPGLNGRTGRPVQSVRAAWYRMQPSVVQCLHRSARPHPRRHYRGNHRARVRRRSRARR